MSDSQPLLAADEPPPVRLLYRNGRSDFLFTADHAGRRIPRDLATLGVAARERSRHIGWDIGIAEVTRRLARRLDATAVLQRYSRLVIDCNRPPTVPNAFPEISEDTPIPGNQGLSEAAKLRRRVGIFDPYHGTIEQLIEGCKAAGRRTVYVAMHSFTPVFRGATRSMQCGLLYNRNPRLSLVLAKLLAAEGGIKVALNAPYRVSDSTDYGVPEHAEKRGLDYLEIEIRQDLIGEPADQARWAALLARLLPVADAVMRKETA
ncbi:MAG: N-formylglutamate amidohydrolase [Acetobacteraceae bacterium]